MPTDWESTFRSWAQPPGETEQQRSENAIRSIRQAIHTSAPLKARDIKVFVQGSYRNRVTVRQDSDVDVGVMAHDIFLAHYPEGKTAEDFGNHDVGYSFAQFKNELETALRSHFGRAAVERGNKAFTIRANNHHVEADVAPFFEFRHHTSEGWRRAGVALVPDNGGRIENFPERLLPSWPPTPLHYENGVSKNQVTRRSFKGVVRILKRLRSEMENVGSNFARTVPGYLLECLSWNAPDHLYQPLTWKSRVEGVSLYLWGQTSDDAQCREWTEVDGIKYLFHPAQPWTLADAHGFLDEARRLIGGHL